MSTSPWTPVATAYRMACLRSQASRPLGVILTHVSSKLSLPSVSRQQAATIGNASPKAGGSSTHLPACSIEPVGRMISGFMLISSRRPVPLILSLVPLVLISRVSSLSFRRVSSRGLAGTAAVISRGVSCSV